MVTVGAFGGICAAAMADIIMMEARRPEPAALARELKSRELAWVFISIALIIVLIVIVLSVIVLVSCAGRRCPVVVTARRLMHSDSNQRSKPGSSPDACSALF